MGAGSAEKDCKGGSHQGEIKGAKCSHSQNVGVTAGHASKAGSGRGETEAGRGPAHGIKTDLLRCLRSY
jgi:hypothetical protein